MKSEDNILVTKVRKAIHENGTKLYNKAVTSGLPENFGQEEVTKLKEEFDYENLVNGTPAQKKSARLIDSFEIWCKYFVVE